MDAHITLITLGVSNLQRSVAFYEGGLGLPRSNNSQAIAFFQMRGTILSLYPWDKLAEDAQVPSSGSGFRGFTLSHNVASREEVDQILDQAVKAGAKLAKPAQKAAWGGYHGYFSDPDDHLWEVAWNPDL